MTDRIDEIIAKLEPDVQAFTAVRMPRIDIDTMLLVSIAISAKRIADALDHICNYGIITGET
jgi:hypothetical protein